MLDGESIEVREDAGFIQVVMQLDPGSAEDLLRACLGWDPDAHSAIEELVADLELVLREQ